MDAGCEEGTDRIPFTSCSYHSKKGEIMANFRIGRVTQEVLREVNDILMKKVRDPRVSEATITDVELTGDLQQATIFYTTRSTLASDRKATQEGLEKSKGLIRKELGKRLTLYKIPDLFFKRDESVEYGNHIDDLLQKIKDSY